MPAQNLTRFRFSIDELPPVLRPAGEKGNVFFYTYGSHNSVRHIQLFDGTIVCHRKPKLADGSVDVVQFDGTEFQWWDSDMRGYNKIYRVYQIENPISCKCCQKWLTINFQHPQ